MPGSAPRRSSIDRFDASVEEGTFGGYEAFGVYSEDAGSSIPPVFNNIQNTNYRDNSQQFIIIHWLIRSGGYLPSGMIV